MAAVQTRERSASTKKPFGWIQRLYKKSSTHDGEESVHAVNLTSRKPLGAVQTFDNESCNLSMTHTNDVSSLRPTISTRAHSIDSNAAGRHVDAISSPIVDTDQLLTPRPNHHSDPDNFPSTMGDGETLVDRNSTHYPLISSDNHKSGPYDSHFTNEAAKDENRDAFSRNDDFIRSTGSSTGSPIPSLFSNKTTETAPTASLFPPPSSIMSFRTVAGLGATDNASMLTLASSSKGPLRRRTSTDTSCSVRALAPASGRASFESSRTGYTESRRTGQHNSNNLILLDDPGQGHIAGRPKWNNDGMSSRSIGGMSVKSDVRLFAPDEDRPQNDETTMQEDCP